MLYFLGFRKVEMTDAIFKVIESHWWTMTSCYCTTVE